MEARMDVTVGMEFGTPVSEDAAADFLCAIVDEMDDLGMELCAHTSVDGRRMELKMDVIYKVPSGDALVAFDMGFTAIKTALHAAGVVTAPMQNPLRAGRSSITTVPRVVTVQPALRSLVSA